MNRFFHEQLVGLFYRLIRRGCILRSFSPFSPQLFSGGNHEIYLVNPYSYIVTNQLTWIFIILYPP
ncbi:hypothetical protein Hanom_Chr01g00049451 [Helianthus anomalus]